MNPKVKWRMILMYTLGNSLCLIAVIITISSVMIFGNMIHYTHAQDKSTLQLSTNKKTYKPGETVTITIKINGKSTLEFSDSTLGLIIQNSKTKQKAGMLGSQMMSELKPGESKTVQWDQKDTEGNKYKQELIRLKPLLQLTKIQIIHPQLL
jgi:uncharacterized cupredoxin-like copper-binding protein